MAVQPKKQASPIWGLMLLAGLGLWLFGAFYHPSPEAATRTFASSKVVVTYTLSGSASRADLTYIDGSGNIQQQTGKSVSPNGSTGLSFYAAHGQYVSFSAQNNGASGSLHCSIEADGAEVNSGDSSGGYAIVSCSATLP